MKPIDELNSAIEEAAPSERPDPKAVAVQRHWQATGEIPRSYVAKALHGSFSTSESLRAAVERSMRAAPRDDDE